MTEAKEFIAVQTQEQNDLLEDCGITKELAEELRRKVGYIISSRDTAWESFSDVVSNVLHPHIHWSAESIYKYFECIYHNITIKFLLRLLGNMPKIHQKITHIPDKKRVIPANMRILHMYASGQRISPKTVLDNQEELTILLKQLIEKKFGEGVFESKWSSGVFSLKEEILIPGVLYFLNRILLGDRTQTHTQKEIVDEEEIYTFLLRIVRKRIEKNKPSDVNGALTMLEYLHVRCCDTSINDKKRNIWHNRKREIRMNLQKSSFQQE